MMAAMVAVPWLLSLIGTGLLCFFVGRTYEREKGRKPEDGEVQTRGDE
jgi:hypothetical protein